MKRPKRPKRPNINKKPYSTNQEIKEWNDFISLILAITALIVSIVVYFLA